MKLGSLAGARAEYYDRNATSFFNSYSATVSPHGQTTRFTTTIASGFKAFIEVQTVYAQRQTAATTSGTVQVIGRCVSGVNSIDTVFVTTTSLAVAATLFDIGTATITLYAGESVQGATVDASIGGTVFFAIAVKGTQFDA
jgi:hypothetical protein